MVPDPNFPESWPRFRPLLIAHDVARSRDHSTAVLGGPSPFESAVTGVLAAHELPQNLFGHARASALAAIDRQYHSNALIIADVTHDPSYAETLFSAFGRRVIGLHITRYGDGQQPEVRPVAGGAICVYTIGRTYLFDKLQSELIAGQVRLSQGDDVRRAYDQLTKLETEYRQSGTVYTCPVGQHDDLAISIAMLVWAARHPHLYSWVRALERQVRRPKSKVNWDAWT